MEDNTKEDLCALPGEENTEVNACEEVEEAKGKSPKIKQFLQVLKFTAFSASAGVIQLLSFSILYDWTHWLPWWPAYLISLVLSVAWNFTFNRKFTFAAATNLPISMCLVALYYCAFTPISVFGGDAMTAAIGEQFGIITTITMMIINFVTEFFWDKFVVFNDVVIGRIEKLLKRKKKSEQEDVQVENISDDVLKNGDANN